jgi:N-terminal acetyltransferase B complex catalytic subunit
VSDASKCYFVDLFVRCSNALAIGMYKKLGYVEYRRIREYYSGEEDAFGECARARRVAPLRRSRVAGQT